ncbi:hypothetical protein QUF76_15535, partial [Desulfobacterales bacterium HSG16]|nr:hypothetical protein [Desulfobacterales bacterium HSG16]
ELRQILLSRNKRFLIANSNRQIQDILKRTGFDLHDQVAPPKKIELPTLSESRNPDIIAPAEVEIE